MGNIVQYLQWRGDLSLEEEAFGLADAVVLAQMAYMDVKGIAPGSGEDSLTIGEMCARFVQLGRNSVGFQDLNGGFSQALAESARFRDLAISHFVDVLDEESHREFSAMVVDLGQGRKFLVYRGTGDTIVGWREDFCMTWQVVGAQKLAARYLLERMEEDGEGIYLLGGHSKGGNLAIYAAMQAPEEIQSRIEGIYALDAPGFCKDAVDLSGYAQIKDKVCLVMPHFGIVGALFANKEPDVIVRSHGEGFLQHELLSWEVKRNDLVREDGFHPDSLAINGIFDQWIESGTLEQREAFTKDFFDALEKGGNKKMSQVPHKGLEGVQHVLEALAGRRETKEFAGKLAGTVAENLKKMPMEALLDGHKMALGVLCFGTGLAFMALPAYAGKLLSLAIGAVVLAWMVQKLLKAGMDGGEPKTKRIKILWWAGCMCLVVGLYAQGSFVSRFSGMVISAFFFAVSYLGFRKSMRRKLPLSERLVMGVMAVAALGMGILPVLFSGLEVASYAFFSGLYVFLWGVGWILQGIYRQEQKRAQEEV